jgi:hypothetical protein
MDCSAAVPILVLLLIAAVLGWLTYLTLFRQEVVATAGLQVSLRHQYPKNIVTYNLEAQEETWRRLDAELTKQTEKLHAEFIEAHKRLSERFRWDPFRNTVINRRVYAYEIARNKLLAANEAGPTTIYINSFIYPDFIAGNYPNASGGVRST